MIKVCNLEAQYIPHSIFLFIFPCRQMLGMFKVQVLRLSFKIINRSLRVALKIQIKDEEEQIYYCLIVNIDGEERNSNKNSQLWWPLWMNYVTPLAKIQFSSVAQSCPTLQPHGLRHARSPCPSPTPGVNSNSCPLSWWCHPAISSSVVPFSSRAFDHSQYQGLFKWVSFSQQVAKELKFQLQHQSFQWIFRTDFL